MADISHPVGKPGGEGKEEQELQQLLDSSVVSGPLIPIRGKGTSYRISFPVNAKGKEIEKYFKEAGTEGVEIDSMLDAAMDSKNKDKGFEADTKSGLNFTIICKDRFKKEFIIILRRR